MGGPGGYRVLLVALLATIEEINVTPDNQQQVYILFHFPR